MELIKVTEQIDLVVEHGRIRVVIGGEDVPVESVYMFKRALDQADLIAMEQTQTASAEYSGRCQVHLIHADKSESRCVLAKAHLLSDSDHQDEHGHRAPVLVTQSAIREVRALQEARDAGLID